MRAARIISIVVCTAAVLTVLAVLNRREATPEPAPVPAPAVTTPVLPSSTAAPARVVPHARPRLCRPQAVACVDLGLGLAWLQADRRIVRGPFRISDGMRSHPTPTGSFHVSWKARYRVSSVYGLPMPYAVYFAAGGIAFHEGALDEASHGCVHLGHRAAALFFDALDRSDLVVVRN